MAFLANIESRSCVCRRTSAHHLKENYGDEQRGAWRAAKHAQPHAKGIDSVRPSRPSTSETGSEHFCDATDEESEHAPEDIGRCAKEDSGRAKSALGKDPKPEKGRLTGCDRIDRTEGQPR
jgi:hypothetical protein